MSRMAHDKRIALYKIPSAPVEGTCLGLAEWKDRRLPGQGSQYAARFFSFTFLVAHLEQLGLMTELSDGVSKGQHMNRIVCHSTFSVTGARSVAEKGEHGNRR